MRERNASGAGEVKICPGIHGQVNPVVIVSTGGTIDKIYDENQGTLENRGSFLEKKLCEHLRLPYTSLHWVPLMSKDSLVMNEADRELIFQTVQQEQSKGYPIVILHGTDTVDLTAQWCVKRLPQPEVAIVFTGAIKPFGFTDSDAIQNVTEALLASKLLPPGWYISFHNQVYLADAVRKNRERMTFEAV